MPENSLIDPVAIQNLRDLGDPEFLAEIIGISHQGTPRCVAELPAALETTFTAIREELTKLL
jgi:hypothetical protein